MDYTMKKINLSDAMQKKIYGVSDILALKLEKKRMTLFFIDELEMYSVYKGNKGVTFSCNISDIENDIF